MTFCDFYHLTVICVFKKTRIFRLFRFSIMISYKNCGGLPRYGELSSETGLGYLGYGETSFRKLPVFILVRLGSNTLKNR